MDNKITANEYLKDFGADVDRYYKYIFGVIYSKTGNVDISSDLTQDTFLIACVNYHKLNDAGKTKSWLRVIAENIVNMYFRKHAKESKNISFDLLFDNEMIINTDDKYVDYTIDKSICEKETEKSLSAAFSKLSYDLRITIVLHVLCRFTYKECAGFLEISEYTFANRLYKSKKMLREELLLMEKNGYNTIDTIVTNGIFDTKKITDGIGKFKECAYSQKWIDAFNVLKELQINSSDNGTAHYCIAECGYTLISLIRCEGPAEMLDDIFKFCETEYKVAAKLGATGISFFGDYEVKNYSPYSALSFLYTQWNKIDLAREYNQKAADFGLVDDSFDADAAYYTGDYDTALNYYNEFLYRDDLTLCDKFTAWCYIRNCYKGMNAEDAYLNSVNKTITLISQNIEEAKELCLDEATILYETACMYAEKDNADKCLEWLEKAVQSDNNAAVWARKNKLFTKYLDKPGFNKILVGNEVL